MDRATLHVLELVSRGLTTPEVADRLEMPAEVVRDHLRQAMDELGASSKLEAVILALRAGLIR
jgi:two-component system, NarL family, nitrate/nitrite response regulator NarL